MHCLCYRKTLQCTLIKTETCDMTIFDPHTGKFGVRRVNPQHFQSLNLLCQLWHCLEEVCNQAEVCNLENRGFSILVDCHNDLAVLHTSQVLDCARDANSNDVCIFELVLRRDKERGE